jgi:hypothetical protein
MSPKSPLNSIITSTNQLPPEQVTKLATSPGTFLFNPTTQKVLLCCKVNTKITNDPLPVKILGDKEVFISNQIELPDFIVEHKLVGGFTISRSFENHPSISFNLVCSRDEKDDVREKFRDREIKYVFYGIPFRCTNYSETIHERSVHPIGHYDINISFEGWYSKLINQPLFVKNRGTSNITKKPFSAPECKIDGFNSKPSTRLANSLNKPDELVVPLSSYASRLGIIYLGYDFLCNYQKPVSPDLTTTFASELDSRKRTKGLYVIYSSDEGIKTVKWAKPSKYKVGEKKITSVVNYSDNMSELGYKPSELTWNKSDEEPLETNEEDTYQNAKPQWLQLNIRVKESISDPDNASSPPNDEGLLKTVDLNYDASGKIKVKTTTKREGTTIIWEKIETWGFMYLSKDILITRDGESILEASPSNYWGLTEVQETTYLFDSTTGYYLGNKITGWKMCRFKQESSTETAKLEQEKLAIADPLSKLFESDEVVRGEKLYELNQVIDCYRFRAVPISGGTQFILRQNRDYYQDANGSSPNIPYQVCTSDGKLATKYMRDPTWVEPMHIGEEYTFYSCFSRIEDPANLALRREFRDSPPETVTDNPIYNPPLTTGREMEIYKKTFIHRSKSTIQEEGLGFTSTGSSVKDNFVGDDKDGLEDKYETHITERSAQDSNFRNASTNIRIEDGSGRPPEATRKQLPFVPKTEESLKENSDVYYTMTETKRKDAIQKPKDTYRHLLITQGYNVNDPIQGSVSYNTKHKSEAFLGAITDLEIDDMNNNCSISFTTLFRPEMVEGSKVTFNYSWDAWKCRLISSSSSVEIEGYRELEDGTLLTEVTGSTSLSLGIDSSLGSLTSLTKVKLPRENTEPTNNTINSPNEVHIFDMYTRGKELGKIAYGFGSRYSG